MKHFARFICKFKFLIIIIAILLIIPSIIGFNSTKINYDILVYLPEDLETVKGEEILSKEFNMGGFSIVIVEDMKAKDLLKLEEKIKKIDNVEKVVSSADLVGSNIPVEVVPNEVKEKIYKDNSTLMLVTFKEGISSDETVKSVEELRKITDERCKISGMTAALIDTRNLSDKEILSYVLIAVILCLIILQVALDSFFVPFIILANIGLAILYNMGTNIFLGEISYITKAISAVLQLGVTMDFSIFLYHSFQEEKKNNKDLNDAMTKAIGKTFTSVLGSSLTTFAGFLALCSMNLTLGKDIGLVMAKGVLFGLINVVTVLPALLLIFNNLVEKTKHKLILPKFRHIKEFCMKFHIIIIILFIIIYPFAWYAQNNTTLHYKLDDSLPESLPSVTANNELAQKYGLTSQSMILINKDLDDYKINEMTEKLEQIDGISFVLSYSKIGETIPKEILPSEIKDIFISDNYQMILVSSDYEIASNELNAQIRKVNSIIKEYDKNAMFVGEGCLMKDLVEVSNHDFNAVNIFSIGVIFVIMIMVLGSISLPIILICVIEFAIFINMGIPFFTGKEVPFIASIVIGTIQLGATIDYAILITTKYLNHRREGLNKNDAVGEALGSSIPSIIVSGLCFFGATFGVGAFSKIDLISTLCIFMAPGAILSVITVITVLPAMLVLFDKIIIKTTKNMKEVKN